MDAYILAIDQGTTSSRAIIYNAKMEVISSHAVPFKQYFPKPDWVEHNLNEIWSSVVEAIRGAIHQASKSQFHVSKIKAIGVTNQRETFGLWQRASGEPEGPAIVWQCRRSSEICSKLKKQKKANQLLQ